MSGVDRSPGSEIVIATTVGEAEGSRAAAAALACAGADADRATLLIDVGGRAPRPTLLASSAAHRLEERLVAHLSNARVAARGQVCHLAVPPESDGLDLAGAAATVARDALVVIHLPAALFQLCLDQGLGTRLGGVMLRADIATDRALLALVVRGLRSRGIAVAVLKRRLSWVAERRALFGALGPDGAGALPGSMVRRLLPRERNLDLDDPGSAPLRMDRPARGHHSGAGSR